MPSNQGPRTPRLSRHFDHQAAEPAWIAQWGNTPFHHPQDQFPLHRASGEPWFLPMPPPNITGQLHLGHALFLTIQDIATRHRLQRGDDACWIPGTDHAGLATHEKLTAYLISQGLDPTDPGLYDQQARAWKERFHARITTQMRAMGIACDWTKERFTLDASYQDSMRHAFSQLAHRAQLHRRDGQWYLDMREAARALLEAIDQGEIRITPATATGRLRHFLENIEPWCISRQIRWGWRLPLLHDGQGSWQLDDHPDRPAPPGWIREQDTADTWLLSSLWPLALLGWPHDQEAMARYFPAAWMETGEDILFFWCARMLMTGWLLTGQWAFRDIWLQGLIRDKHGRKMSKSLDNGIDPLELTDKHGTDALRWMLATRAEPGLDMRFNPADLSAEAKFINKLWQAARFFDLCPPLATGDWSDHEDELALDALTDTWDQGLLGCRFAATARALQSHFRDDFCSGWIERNKEACQAGDPATLSLGLRLLQRYLALLHPFLPFITSEIDAQLGPGRWD